MSTSFSKSPWRFFLRAGLVPVDERFGPQQRFSPETTRTGRRTPTPPLEPPPAVLRAAQSIVIAPLPDERIPP